MARILPRNKKNARRCAARKRPLCNRSIAAYRITPAGDRSRLPRDEPSSRRSRRRSVAVTQVATYDQSSFGAGSTIGPPGSGNVGRGRGRGNPVPQPGPVQPSPFGPGRTPPATVTSVLMSMDTIFKIVSVAVTFALFFMTND